MFRRKLWLVLVAALTVAAVAAGIAVAEKDKGNDKNFEHAIGLWARASERGLNAQTSRRVSSTAATAIDAAA